MTAIYFSVLEAEIPSKNKGPEDSVSGEVLLLVHIWPSSCCVLIWQMSEGALRFLLWGHSFHSWGLCSHLLITSQRYHLQTPSHQRLDFNTWISRDTNIQSIALMHYQDPSPVKNLVLQHKFELRVRHDNKRRVILPPEPSLGSAEALTGATSKLNFSPSPILIFLHFLP